jgi:predicted alpha/beta superfamily hydrolase
MLLILGFPRPTLAQEVTATLGVTRTIKSTILNEDRKVLVHLPSSYNTSGNSYPVLYLLDGTPAAKGYSKSAGPRSSPTAT